jgi:hypothetical protein
LKKFYVKRNPNEIKVEGPSLNARFDPDAIGLTPRGAMRFKDMTDEEIVNIAVQLD